MSGSNLVNSLNAPEPSFEGLHEMLARDASVAEIDVEVRRLCLVCFVIGNERGIAYVIGMNKSDEAIDEAD